MLIIALLAGCGKGQKQVEEFLVTLVTRSIYKEAETNKDKLPIELESYFTEEGYKDFVKLQMGYVYPEFFRLSKADATKNVQIKEVKKVKLGNETRLKYKVEYTVVYGKKQVKMKDQVTIKINKDYKITEFVILNTSDVMEKMFLGVKVL